MFVAERGSSWMILGNKTLVNIPRIKMMMHAHHPLTSVKPRDPYCEIFDISSKIPALRDKKSPCSIMNTSRGLVWDTKICFRQTWTEWSKSLGL